MGGNFHPYGEFFIFQMTILMHQYFHKMSEGESVKKVKVKL